MPALPLSVMQISDLHADPANPADRQRCDRVRETIAAIGPDLIINTGDVSSDGMLQPEMFDGLKAWQSEMGVPVYTVPGNHDVGNSLGEEKPVVCDAFIDRYLQTFDDRFSVNHQGWRFIGINSMLLGSGLDRETDQLEWFIAELDLAQAAGELVSVWMHMPLFLQNPDEVVTGGSAYWIPDPPVRDKWIAELDRACVRLVGSGHCHWYASTRAMDVDWVWAPSLQGLVVDDYLFPPGGKISGLVHHRLGEDAISHEVIPVEMPEQLIRLNYPEQAEEQAG